MLFQNCVHKLSRSVISYRAGTRNIGELIGTDEETKRKAGKGAAMMFFCGLASYKAYQGYLGWMNNRKVVDPTDLESAQKNRITNKVN